MLIEFDEIAKKERAIFACPKIWLLFCSNNQKKNLPKKWVNWKFDWICIFFPQFCCVPRQKRIKDDYLITIVVFFFNFYSVNYVINRFECFNQFNCKSSSFFLAKKKLFIGNSCHNFHICCLMQTAKQQFQNTS